MNKRGETLGPSSAYCGWTKSCSSGETPEWYPCNHQQWLQPWYSSVAGTDSAHPRSRSRVQVWHLKAEPADLWQLKAGKGCGSGRFWFYRCLIIGSFPENVFGFDKQMGFKKTKKLHWVGQGWHGSSLPSSSFFSLPPCGAPHRGLVWGVTCQLMPKDDAPVWRKQLFRLLYEHLQKLEKCPPAGKNIGNRPSQIPSSTTRAGGSRSNMERSVFFLWDCGFVWPCC